MGGFTNLKNEFDAFLKEMKPRPSTDKERFRQDIFRFLYLRSLFEIAGNLDSIALCQRALVEQAEKSRLQQAELFEQAQKMFQEVASTINRPVHFDSPVFTPEAE